MLGILVALLAIASAPRFACAIGNFKMCQRQLYHSLKASLETSVSRVNMLW